MGRVKLWSGRTGVSATHKEWKRITQKHEKRRKDSDRSPQTLIREGKDRVLYFSAEDRSGVQRDYTLTALGKDWLAGHGIRAGTRVPRRIVESLIDSGKAHLNTDTKNLQREVVQLFRNNQLVGERRIYDTESEHLTSRRDEDGHRGTDVHKDQGD